MKLTHPDKILYPGDGITKEDVAKYLVSVQDLILPYLDKRLLSIVTCPGNYKECFYKKHTANQTKYLSYFTVKNVSGIEKYFYVKDVSSLLYLAQMNSLEIHPWGSTISNIEKPDIILFDLDPSPSVKWGSIIEIAHLIRAELKKLNLVSFVKTTGGKGLHISVPIKPKYDWDKIKNFAKLFADYIVSLKPDLCVATMSKSKRRGKIFIDYLRNTRGATAVAPYSLRARKGAPIATPIKWSELTDKMRSDSFNIKNIGQRISRLKEDPWQDFYTIKQELTPHQVRGDKQSGG